MNKKKRIDFIIRDSPPKGNLIKRKSSDPSIPDQTLRNHWNSRLESFEPNSEIEMLFC